MFFFFNSFHNIIKVVYLLIQFWKRSLQYDILNLEPYFLANV